MAVQIKEGQLISVVELVIRQLQMLLEDNSAMTVKNKATISLQVGDNLTINKTIILGSSFMSFLKCIGFPLICCEA